MDKTMFKGYVRELVREMIAEELRRVLPPILKEAVGKVSLPVKPSAPERKPSAPSMVSEGTKTVPKQGNRSPEQIRQMLGLSRPDSETIVAKTSEKITGIMPEIPLSERSQIDFSNPEVHKTLEFINKDYSGMFKE